jgi:cytochrome c-type biogenesis protein CcmH
MRVAVIGAVAALVALVFAIVVTSSGGGSHAPSGDISAQALAVEHQLLCPQCTNERLDICNLAICNDMKGVIRERLQGGQSQDEIVGYFRNRYGERVLSQVPREGFNLVLFGWVGGSLLLVAIAGGAFIVQLRRGSNASTRVAISPTADDEWIDRQLEADE